MLIADFTLSSPPSGKKSFSKEFKFFFSIIKTELLYLLYKLNFIKYLIVSLFPVALKETFGAKTANDNEIGKEFGPVFVQAGTKKRRAKEPAKTKAIRSKGPSGASNSCDALPVL